MSAVKTPCSQPRVHRRSWAPKPSGKRKTVLESHVSEAAHAADHFGGPLPWLEFSSHEGASLWKRLSECVKVLPSAVHAEEPLSLRIVPPISFTLGMIPRQ